MRTYRTKEDVPWRDILHILRWYLRMKSRAVRQHLESGDQRAAQTELPSLQTGYASLTALRRFLGHSGQTRWEREAETLLHEELRKQ